MGIIVLAMHMGMKELPGRDQPSSDRVPPNRSLEGATAPDFSVATRDGENFTLSENVGKKVIVLNFFATWCGPCKQEIPELNELYQKFENDDFILLGICSGEAPDTVDGFISGHRPAFPVAIDENGAVGKKYMVNAFPTTVLIGADGRIQMYRVGAVQYEADSDYDHLNMLVSKNLAVISDGTAITSEEYAKTEDDADDTESEVDDGGISERSMSISQRMYCPCGCSHLVSECGCKTAKDITKDLEEMDFGNKTDAEITRELNSKYCETKGD